VSQSATSFTPRNIERGEVRELAMVHNPVGLSEVLTILRRNTDRRRVDPSRFIRPIEPPQIALSQSILRRFKMYLRFSCGASCALMSFLLAGCYVSSFEVQIPATRRRQRAAA
jgi:hypothetical protein